MAGVDVVIWPDVEAAVCDWLADLGTVRTWYPHPDDLEPMLPLIMVQRTGGGSPDGLQDVALVVIAVTDTTRAESWALMGRIRDRVRDASRGFDSAAALVDAVSEQVGPQQIPQLNPDHREVQMTFQVICRPHRT